jgi:hypothetical protein
MKELMPRIIFNFFLIIFGMIGGYYWGEIHFFGHFFGH